MGKRTFTAFVRLCFACRDVWAMEALSEGVYIRETKFREFKTSVLDAFFRAEPPSPVVELMKLFVSPNDPHGYTRDALKQYLSIRQNDRNYRAVASGDVGSHDKDYRVRNLMEALIEEKEQTATGGSTMNVWICPFFTSRMPEADTPRKALVHSTDRCTRFEQLLFLMGVSRLSTVFGSRRSRKRRIVGELVQSDQVLESIRTFTGSVSQKLGHGIQKLCRGWNVIALHFGFNGLEDMVTPYTRIVAPPFTFEVVKSRDDGFVPKSQLRGIEVNVPLTLSRDETFSEAFDRSNEIDTNVRALVQELFNDFYSIIAADGLYGEVVWKHLNEYESSGAGLPKRFKRLDTTMVDVLEMAFRTGAEGVSKVPSSSRLAQREDSSGSGRQGLAGEELEEDASEVQNEGNISNVDEMSVLQVELSKRHRMPCCSYGELLEAHEHLYPRETLTGEVQLILTDPPFNIRRTNNFKNSSYDSLSVKDMDGVVEVFDDLLRPGGHGILFCTAQQFPLWMQKFNASSGKNFVADKTPLIMAWHPSSNKSFPGRWSTSLQNCVEQAVHVKKKGLSVEKEGEMVNYTNFNFVSSDYPGHKNVINNIRGLEVVEQVRVPSETDGTLAPLRNEQKPKALLKELISRFRQPGELVVDLFCGTFSTAIACFSLEQHRRFLGCELDKACFDHAQSNVCVQFACAICEGNTDLDVSEEIRASARKVKSVSKVRRPDANWAAPVGLPQYQAVRDHIVSYLANLSGDRFMYIRYKHRGVHDWPAVIQGKLQEADVQTLRAIDALASDVVVERSLIKCSHAGLGLFAVRSFGPGDVIGPFYGTLVYHNLFSRPASRKTYGRGVLGVTLERFRRYAIQVQVKGKHFGKVRDLMDGQKAVSIVPSVFCAMGYAKDYPYHPDDEEFGPGGTQRKANAVFTGKVVNHPDELLSPFARVLKATEFINPGDEMYVDYGNTFQVFVSNCK